MGVDDEALVSIFGQYGNVVWSKVMPSKGKPTQAAIVEFGDIAEAKWVVENVNGNVPQGLTTPLTITFKREKQNKGVGKGYGPMGSKGFPAGGKGFSPYGNGKNGTEVCRNFQNFGECKYGDACKFSHGNI